MLCICYLSAIECHNTSNSPGTRVWNHQQNSFGKKRRTRKRVESGEKNNCAVIIGSVSKKREALVDSRWRKKNRNFIELLRLIKVEFFREILSSNYRIPYVNSSFELIHFSYISMIIFSFIQHQF